MLARTVVGGPYPFDFVFNKALGALLEEVTGKQVDMPNRTI